jgi:CheY-like chemotaxis protein
MDTYQTTSAVPFTEVSPSRPSRILVIDDDRYVRSLLADLLEAWGYEFDSAADGREGLRRFEPGRYQVVLTDLGMPGLSGTRRGRRRARPGSRRQRDHVHGVQR